MIPALRKSPRPEPESGGFSDTDAPQRRMTPHASAP